MPMLEVKDLHVSYGMIDAVRGASFHLNEGEIVALIGSNGAGKSTILRTISGLEQAKSGSILFEGKELTKMSADQIVKCGISHVPEGRRIFSRLNVSENLVLGATLCKDKRLVKERMDWVLDIFPRLKDRYKQVAGTLSGGEQQMLAFGRALMTGGKLMLLDEPSMGLAPIIVEDIFEVIKEVNKNKISILLIEQNAYLALNTASRAYVLETGKVTLEGDANVLMSDNRVKEAYLGA